MRLVRLTVFAFAVTGSLLSVGSPATAQRADLLADPAVRLLVEEVLIADLMLRSCEGLAFSEEGRGEVQGVADALARDAGYTPEEAAEHLSDPRSREQLEAGARRRLAMMGARPEDPEAVCSAASRALGRGGVLGTLLTATSPENE